MKLLSRAFPGDLMKNTARNSHSFISFSCYGLSWSCRTLFASELKISRVGSALCLAASLPGWEVAWLMGFGPLRPLCKRFRVRGEERKLWLGPGNSHAAWHCVIWHMLRLGDSRSL